jgi:hypothetical protein
MTEMTRTIAWILDGSDRINMNGLGLDARE